MALPKESLPLTNSSKSKQKSIARQAIQWLAFLFATAHSKFNTLRYKSFPLLAPPYYFRVMFKRLLLLLLYAWWLQSATAQGGFAFRHLTAEQGLADGVVRAVGQDKYGYIWISTLSGLNRFDGYTVKTFYNSPSDTASLPPHTVRAIYGDKEGRLWIGHNGGLSSYNYGTESFVSMTGAHFGVLEIDQLPSGLLLLNTSKGHYLFNPATRIFSAMKFPDGDTLWAHTFFIHGPVVYFASHIGLWRYDSRSAALVQLRKKEATAVAKDGSRNLWYVTESGAVLHRSTDDSSLTATYTQFGTSPTGNAGGSVNDLFVDRQGQLWGVTNMNGLLHYNPLQAKFHQYLNNPSEPTSISSNLVAQIFQSARGYLWMGTEGHGVNYFHPERSLFHKLPLPEALQKEASSLQWVRSFVVDGRGDWWIGMGGLVHLRADGTLLHHFRNEGGKAPQLQDNSVRGLLCDNKGDVWIGTRNGVNKWEAATGRILFLDENDSLPRSFYWTMLQDRDGTLWFGERGNLHYKTKNDKTARSIAAHPVLKNLNGRGVRSIYEDSGHRLWFGMNGSGLVMWDKSTNRVQQWKRSEGVDTVLLNNTIVDIVEDKSGELWFSSFTGLTAYNPELNRFRWYTQANGMPSVKTSSLMVDAKNRLWIGSTKGLLLLDSSRNRLTSFTTADGLPTMEFSDMRGTKLPDGRFAMPTVNGMLLFNPMDYQPDRQNLRVWLNGVSFLGQKIPVPNPEELKELELRWDQNFFTLGLGAVHYSNPDAVWYAYKLDGFDEDWIYTKGRLANYTNVPGGRYTFRYKATTDPNNWAVPEKTLLVSIGTVFYKAWWFWLAVGAIVLASVWRWYKAREVQQRRIFSLQTKAQALEKEKAAVLYENLKQQLNPHFLFNSLTSLGGLIKADQKLAAQFLEGMSKTYRYILKSRDAEVVTLKEELEFVQHYIRLQQTRFETGFEVKIDVPEKYGEKKLAPVTLQNLVENAIKHNIIDDDSPLVVSIFTEGDCLVVRNNLQKKNFVESSNKQGLAQMKSLYRYLTGRVMEVAEEEGFFTVKVPLI